MEKQPAGLGELPTSFPYLGEWTKKYLLVRQTDTAITLQRHDGQPVEIPVRSILDCCERLRGALGQKLTREDIIPDGSDNRQYGQSVFAAILVAGGMAEVVREKPLTLKAIPQKET